MYSPIVTLFESWLLTKRCTFRMYSITRRADLRITILSVFMLIIVSVIKICNYIPFDIVYHAYVYRDQWLYCAILAKNARFRQSHVNINKEGKKEDSE